MPVSKYEFDQTAKMLFRMNSAQLSALVEQAQSQLLLRVTQEEEDEAFRHSLMGYPSRSRIMEKWDGLNPAND